MRRGGTHIVKLRAGYSPDRLAGIEDQARGVAAVLIGVSASLSHVNILPQGTVAPLVWVSTKRR